MNKKLWLVAGILLVSPSVNARAEVSIHIGLGDRPSFVPDSRPQFMPLPGMGFAVAVGSPHDVILYGRDYYAFQNGIWFTSADYRGPWVVVHESRIPYGIRRHRWEEIRRSRDIEYRRHDNRYDGRYGWKENRRERFEGDNRDNGNRGRRFDSNSNDRGRRNDGNSREGDTRWRGNENRQDDGGRRN